MEIQEVDGKKFETNGIWNYKNRGIPVGQIGYSVNGSPYRGAALEDGEEEFIFDCPRLVGGGNCINLGDLKGGSAILLAQGLDINRFSGKVYTIDNYSVKHAEASRQRMNREGMSHRIDIMNMRTDDAFSKLTGEYSFIFIDADHSYKGVRNDFIMYHQILKKDGLIAFHDTNQTETNRVIEEHVTKDWKLEFWVNRIKAFSKRHADTHYPL